MSAVPAESGNKFRSLAAPRRAIADWWDRMDVIQAPKPEPRSMRREPGDYEWTAIESMLPDTSPSSSW
jgi:hypothetical protein